MKNKTTEMPCEHAYYGLCPHCLRDELSRYRAENDTASSNLRLQTELLADANAQLNAMRKERDELRSVIEQAHHIVCTHDRVWGGTTWTLHPLSTVSRAHLRRVLEGHARPKHLEVRVR